MATLGRACKAVQLLGGLGLVGDILLLVEDAANAVTRVGGIDGSVQPVRLLIVGGFFVLMAGKLGSWWYER